MELPTDPPPGTPTRIATASFEPTIAEMLGDPIVGLLMQHDGVTTEELRWVLEEARRRLEPKLTRFPPRAE